MRSTENVHDELKLRRRQRRKRRHRMVAITSISLAHHYVPRPSPSNHSDQACVVLCHSGRAACMFIQVTYGWLLSGGWAAAGDHGRGQCVRTKVYFEVNNWPPRDCAIHCITRFCAPCSVCCRALPVGLTGTAPLARADYRLGCRVAEPMLPEAIRQRALVRIAHHRFHPVVPAGRPT
jgi:hypothetical protein